MRAPSSPVLQTRPCPTFGRPVHLGFPHRLRPGTSPHALRIPPHGGHPALRSTASSGSRSALAVSSFRLRARLDVSIPSAFFGQRGITPAFGYGAPHSSARGTLTLPSSALLSAQYPLLRLRKLTRHNVLGEMLADRNPGPISTFCAFSPMRIRIPEYEQADTQNICFRRGARSSSDGSTRVQLLGPHRSSSS
jgi:hypothetical protein